MKDYKGGDHIMEDTTLSRKARSDARVGPKEMSTNTKALWKDCPCQLLRVMIIWISPERQKTSLRLWV